MTLLNYLAEKSDNKYLTLSGILLLAFFVRIYQLNFEGLWTDEMISVYASNPNASLRRMYDVLHFWDQTPPLYPILFWLWLKITGFTELNARLFSVAGGMLSLLAVFFLIREIYNRKTALLITFLLAVTPYHIYFSREARSYIWSFFMTTLVLYFFVRQLKQYDKKTTRFLFILSGGLFLHASYFSFFVHAGLVSILLISFLTKKESVNLKNWFIDYVLVGLLFLPWLFQFIRILGFHNGDQGGKPSPFYIFKMLGVFSAANSGGYILTAAYLLLLLCFIYITFFQKKPFDKINYICLFGLLFILVYVLMFLKSITGRNILNGFMYSYVIVLLPVFLILIGGIFAQLDKKIIAPFLVVFIVANIYNHKEWYRLGYYKKFSEPYRELAAFISTSPQAKAPILCYGSYLQEFYFYTLKMDGQLVDYTVADKKITPALTKYFWIVESFDTEKSEKLLKEMEQKYPVSIKEIKHIKATTGKFIFRALLLEFKPV